DDITLAYFYHPIRGQIFIDVIERIRASVARNPRPFRLIYLNPRMHDELISRGFHVARQMSTLGRLALVLYHYDPSSQLHDRTEHAVTG
ncbi:MAG TPA: hypothetical protein VHB98_24320, partial [Chloroflexota bacterium]|nr:hypothetical protein [Chloroflexota bacterium]